MYHNRTIEEKLKSVSRSFPCIAIYGPRQCGKSTLVENALPPDFERVSLDDGDELRIALANPKLFLDSHPAPLIIDEIQKAPGLLPEIKRRIDLKKLEWLKGDEPNRLMYVLTGSNQFKLKQGVSESLAGRAAILELNSLSLAEKESWVSPLFAPELSFFLGKAPNRKIYSRDEIFEEIFLGGMPGFVWGSADRQDYFKSYKETYLSRDVQLLISQDNESAFRDFLSYVALRTAQEVHYGELSSAIGIDVKTLKRWFTILEACGIVVFLHPYMKNASNRIIKAPKVYFMDTGLCAYLCGWPNAKMLSQSSMAGPFFETFVVSEIIKNLQYHGVEWKELLYYYRDIDQKEIDLLYVKGQEITPIEIKKGINPIKPTKNFNVLAKYGLPIKAGFVIDCTDKARPINEKAWSIPIGFIE